MDKYEYKLRSEEIKTLIKERDFVKAVEIADTIDWTRVRSVSMLCTISDLYKINRRYKEAKTLLLQAYEKYPGGRTILYSLCELCIKTDDIVGAIEYYKEFVQLAPTDNGKFILQYKIYEAQDVSLEERIAVLQELKKREYREKWGYELAYLYHRVGLGTKCVEECDELILWFREGPYIKKAMELKMLHQQLTANQEALYKSMLPVNERVQYDQQTKVIEEAAEQEQPVQVQIAEEQELEPEIQVKTVDVSQYATLNLQRELAESMKEVLVADNAFSPLYNETQEAATEEQRPQHNLSEDFLDKIFEDVSKGEVPTETAQIRTQRELDMSVVPVVEAIVDEPETVEKETPASADLMSEESDAETAATREFVVPKEVAATSFAEETVAEPGDGMVEISMPMEPQEEELGEVEELEEIEETNGQNGEYVPGSVTEEILASMMQDQDTDSLQEVIVEVAGIVDESEEFEEASEVKPETISFEVVGQTQEEEPIVEEVVSEEPEETVAEEVVLEEPEEAVAEEVVSEEPEETVAEEAILEEPKETVAEEVVLEEPKEAPVEEVAEEAPVCEPKQEETVSVSEERPSIREVMQGKTLGPDLTQVAPPEKMGHLLSQEYDGQISLVVPEEEMIEKQITGQICLEDILAEWEKTKKENQEQRKQKTQERVLQQTGAMFTDFEAKIRDGILEKLEKNEDISDFELGLLTPPDEEEEKQIHVDVPMESDNEPEIRISMEEIFGPEETGYEQPQESYEEEDIPAEPAEEPVRRKATSESASSDKYEESMRSMTEEEISLFAPFVQTRGARVRLMQALDQISLAAYTGNVFVTGDTREEAVELAKSVVRDVQMTDRNFSGKIAKVTGNSLNNRDLRAMIAKLDNGALIIESASGMDAQTTKDLLRSLNQDKTGIVVVLQDNKKAMHRMMDHFKGMGDIFNVHIEVEELGDEALVAYGKKYARHLEYAIDEMGVLALHTRIDEMQTSDHVVTVADVRDIVDEAIENANRKNLRHFKDVLFAKRYDDEDMIILRERDFLE